MIFLTDSTADVIPAYRTMADTIIALRYSVLPCPRGCFLSGLRLASLAPTMVMTEDRASDRLFTASSVTAMECDRMPMTALKAASRIFAPMPTKLVRTII